jgi:hypothetical protein
MENKNTFALNQHVNHVATVRIFMEAFITRLKGRAMVHDGSKTSEPESYFFINDKNIIALNTTEYGSPEYKAALERGKEAVHHHQTHNRHHPEYYKNGINGMCLVDLIEMICDWKAATERNHNGDIWISIEMNKERFGIDDQLFSILKNTLDAMGW